MKNKRAITKSISSKYYSRLTDAIIILYICIQARREGGQKGSLSGGPGTQGGPGFRIVRFKMQNSSAQTTACGRDDVFFYFGPKFEHLRTL